jgi:glutaredoxin
MSNTKQCPFCKKDVSMGATKCPHCHSDIRNWFRRHSIISFLIFMTAFGLIPSLFLEKKEYSTPQSASNQVTQLNNKVAPPVQSKKINYEIVDSWVIPNGGQGKVIVISPSNLNEPDMVALGEELRTTTSADRNAFIFVFDDKKASLLRDAVLNDKASATDQNFYDKHYVGQYNRNGNTGFNEFVIHFDGIMGSKTKTIKY